MDKIINFPFDITEMLSRSTSQDNFIIVNYKSNNDKFDHNFGTDILKFNNGLHWL